MKRLPDVCDAENKMNALRSSDTRRYHFSRAKRPASNALDRRDRRAGTFLSPRVSILLVALTVISVRRIDPSLASDFTVFVHAFVTPGLPQSCRHAADRSRFGHGLAASGDKGGGNWNHTDSDDSKKRKGSSSTPGDSNKKDRTIKTAKGRSKRKEKKYSERYLNDKDLKVREEEGSAVAAQPASGQAASLKSERVRASQIPKNASRDTSVLDQIEAVTGVTRSKTKRAARGNNVKTNVKTTAKDGSKSTTDAALAEARTPTGKIQEKLENTKEKSLTTDVKKKPKLTIKRRKGWKSTFLSPNKELKEHPVHTSFPSGGFNVVLTHCTADFDSLASAVGLAKLWSSETEGSGAPYGAKTKNGENDDTASDAYKSSSNLPTFVVLPRGAHPGVQKFLALHKHLFPICALRSLPSDLKGLNRLGLVDAQRRDRLGPAEPLLSFAKRVTIVDHHIDGESDIPEASDYVVEKVGSVSTMVTERLRNAGTDLSEAEATLLALGIHADTGSLCFDSTTARDAKALAWAMEQGASQAAIAEHGKPTLSSEQQGVLTQALINTNSTEVHGVTLSTVLLSADGFINGLASVAQDARELTSSDVFLLAVVYDAKSGSGRKRRGKNKKPGEGNEKLRTRLLGEADPYRPTDEQTLMTYADAWKGGEMAAKRKTLKAAFDKKDTDGSGYLERSEIVSALGSTGIIASDEALDDLMASIDTNNDGRIEFQEFLAFAEDSEKIQKDQDKITGRRASTMIIIGRVRAGTNTKDINLNALFQQFGGGGHAKAASATVRLGDESGAGGILQGIVDEMIAKSLVKQPTVGDIMTSPVLSAKPTMTEKNVEDLFIRYDVRALPVVDEDNNVIGLVSYKEVAAAKQRLWNKEQKRIRKEAERAASDAASEGTKHEDDEKKRNARLRGSALKGWMLQHVQTVDASKTMAEVEAVLLDADVGCMPVVADGTKQLVGMVTRTDLLRQHSYYAGLHYNNKGFADSIAARKPIIELRKRLKKYDIDE